MKTASYPSQNQSVLSPILVWRSGISMAYEWFNESWLKFTGRTFDESQGEGWLENIHPDDREEYQNRSAKYIARREIFIIEYRLRHHSGEYRWILDYGAPYYDSCGTFGGFISSSIDIHTNKISFENETDQRETKKQALIQICSYCHKIKIPYCDWEKSEEYLATLHAKSLSHGMCPTCFEMEMQKYDELDQKAEVLF